MKKSLSANQFQKKFRKNKKNQREIKSRETKKLSNLTSTFQKV